MSTEAETPAGNAEVAARPLVVLVGPPASGKSTLMRALAAELGVSGRDTDQDVEATSGVRISEIFATHGEPEFRARERAAVAAALAEHDGILALGGGAVLAAETRARLADYVRAGGVVVFLDVDAQDVAMRIAADTTRPLLAGDALARWTELMDVRRPLYEEVASLRVATGRPLQVVVEEIVGHVQQHARAAVEGESS